MRIAYLIGAYEHYNHLERLIKALDDKDVVFFIHINKKIEMPKNITNKGNIVFIKRIVVWWGTWSLQQMILDLMTEAVRFKFDYYILLSGTHYPIRSNQFIYEKLKTGSEFMDIIKGFHSHKPEYRIKYYYFDCFDRRNRKSLRTKFFFALEAVFRRIATKKHYPFSQIYSGHTWFALTHSCVSYILTFLQHNPQYTRFFKTCFIPDESFIPTIIGNSEFAAKREGSLTYTDWSEKQSGPSAISEKHIELFKHQLEFDSPYGKYTPVFARKFTDKSSDVVKQIDEALRR